MRYAPLNPEIVCHKPVYAAIAGSDLLTGDGKRILTHQMCIRDSLKGKPSYIGIMTGSSIEACSLGNNHTYDYGQESALGVHKSVYTTNIENLGLSLIHI